MVTDVLGSILQELGTAMGIPGLHPDEHNSCLIRFKNGVEAQVEIDQKNPEVLIITIDLGEVPPGKYRENVFRQALKANGQYLSRVGIFAYSPQKEHLVLFAMLDLKEANATKFGLIMTPMLEKAQAWKEAIHTGGLPPLATASTSKGAAGGLFGLL